MIEQLLYEDEGDEDSLGEMTDRHIQVLVNAEMIHRSEGTDRWEVADGYDLDQVDAECHRNNLLVVDGPLRLDTGAENYEPLLDD